jgi:hypothetical protein
MEREDFITSLMDSAINLGDLFDVIMPLAQHEKKSLHRCQQLSHRGRSRV